MIPPQEVVERALAGGSPGGGRVVIVDEETEANLRWASNTLTTNGVTRDRSVTVIEVHGDRVGVVTRRGVAGPAEVAELVDEAGDAARQSDPAEDANPLLSDPSFGDWEAPTAETGIGVFENFSRDLGEAFGDGSRMLYGFALHRVVSTFVGASTGLRARHDQPTGHVEINAKSPDMSRSCWVGVPAADFSGVDVGAMDADLHRRLRWAGRRVELPPGRYDTLLPPSAVADLMIYLYWSAEARDAADGRTVFSKPGGGTRVGERLSGHAITLRSDPEAPGIACAPFVTARRSGGGFSVFDNGAPAPATSWIEKGTLRSLVQTRHSAAVTGLPFTPYVDNLVLDAADSTEEILGSTERGLLLTCLWYIREVDPVTLLLTGLTRDGVYLVEHGEVTAAVNNFRFNESPVDLLARASQFGPTEQTLPREWCDYFTRTAMPMMRVPDFNMSSVSQAS